MPRIVYVRIISILAKLFHFSALFTSFRISPILGIWLRYFISEKQRGRLLPYSSYAVAFSLACFCHTQGIWMQTCLWAEQGRLPSIALPHTLSHAVVICWDVRLCLTCLWSKSDSKTVYVNHLPLAIILASLYKLQTWTSGQTRREERGGNAIQGLHPVGPLGNITVGAWEHSSPRSSCEQIMPHGHSHGHTGSSAIAERKKGILKHKLFKAFSCPLFPQQGCLSPVLR